MLSILPHSKAPLFNNPNDRDKVMKEILTQLSSKTLDVNAKSTIDFIRQAGFVNLWFFLKYIAGSSGPFNFLNAGVHLDLCNFRQSEHCMADGARAMAFLPRGFAKTTIMTIGGNAWELLRNANLRIRIINAVVDRAHGFKHSVQRIFDSNEFFARCYPEAVPSNSNRRWNGNEMVMPHASRLYSEPSLKAGGATGASEGDHHDLLDIDDIIGLDEVDAEFNPNQRMKAVRSWMDTNLTALLISPIKSRVLGAATRFGRGDVYQEIWDNCRLLLGYPQGLPNFKPNPKGSWVIYYRHVVENGTASNPFVMDEERFAKLMREKPIVAALQYANNADISINNELAKLPVKHCYLQSIEEDYVIHRIHESIADDDGLQAISPIDRPVKLSRCNVIMSVDWAGSDKRRSVHTSRTSIGIWAIDSYSRRYRIDQIVGYLALPEVFDAIFKLHDRYKGYIQTTLLEANAMQRGIFDLIVEEQHRRETYISPIECNAKGDKVVRIRSVLSVALSQGSIYVTDKSGIEFIEEQMSFPSPALDVLDESAKAIDYLKAPASDERKQELEVRRIIRKYDKIENRAGY